LARKNKHKIIDKRMKTKRTKKNDSICPDYNPEICKYVDSPRICAFVRSDKKCKKPSKTGKNAIENSKSKTRSKSNGLRPK